MPTLKEYSGKLTRLRSTRKMTRTMKMVSTMKFRRTQGTEKNAREFADSHERLFPILAQTVAAGSHPLATAREPVGKITVLVISSDRGLCGGFNHNLNRLVLRWLRERQKADQELNLLFHGRRGLLFFRKHFPVGRIYEGNSGQPLFDAVQRISRDLQERFMSGQADEVYLACNEFKNMLSQKPIVKRFLPVDPVSMAAGSGDGPGPFPPLVEPSGAAVMNALLARFLDLRLYQTFLSSATGEHAARMTAMDDSTRNCDTLISRYTLLRNRARQASITKELIEIVGGAEALR